MKIIRLVIFNENYWDRGLIYTQNILPLKQLTGSDCKLEIVSFTAYPIYMKEKKHIENFISDMQLLDIKVRNFNVLYYPTRYLLPRIFLIPYFYLNVCFYVKRLCREDKGKNIIYNLRSYQAAQAFNKFYDDHSKLVFDPRTDWIEENINRGDFKEGSLTTNYWYKAEKEILFSFKRTIVISDIFKANLIQRHGLAASDCISILYNPIDYSHFALTKSSHTGKVFLYTGSLGGWNRLENYLDVFSKFHSQEQDSKLIICTSSVKANVEEVLFLEKYDNIRNNVKVYYNVAYDQLPKYYSECDYGLQIMNKKDSRVGVKFVEYVAAGIIPIVSSNVQGAAALSDKYGIGVVLNGNETDTEVYQKIINAPVIDKQSKEYKEFRSLTNLNSINTILSLIYT